MASKQSKQVTRSDRNSSEKTPQAGPGTAGTAQGGAEEDHVYGLASVLYHALQGVTASRKYADDARRAGVDELVEFFEECTLEGSARAKQAKELLVAYSEESDDEDEGDEGDEGEDDEDEDEDEGDG